MYTSSPYNTFITWKPNKFVQGSFEKKASLVIHCKYNNSQLRINAPEYKREILSGVELKDDPGKYRSQLLLIPIT